jgi:hypothetical protein
MANNAQMMRKELLIFWVHKYEIRKSLLTLTNDKTTKTAQAACLFRSIECASSVFGAIFVFTMTPFVNYVSKKEKIHVGAQPPRHASFPSYKEFIPMFPLSSVIEHPLLPSAYDTASQFSRPGRPALQGSAGSIHDSGHCR